MKKFLVVLALCFVSIVGFAQNITYTDISSGKSPKELIGIGAGGNIDTYTASDGITYHIGDTITMGTPGFEKNIYTTLIDITYLILSGKQLPVKTMYGGKFIIKKIQLTKVNSYNKDSGSKIYLVLNNGGYAITNFEQAIEIGEVITRGYNRDAALKELKKYKDMLDLELITQEEYDQKKMELSKFIK